MKGGGKGGEGEKEGGAGFGVGAQGVKREGGVRGRDSEGVTI